MVQANQHFSRREPYLRGEEPISHFAWPIPRVYGAHFLPSGPGWLGGVGEILEKKRFELICPAGMSFSDFLEEQHSIKEIEFLSGASTYELKIHTKKKEVSLIGNIGLVKEFSDGAVLISIASKSAATTDFFQKTLAVPGHR